MTTVDELLAAARARLVRPDPHRAAELVRHGAILVDTREIHGYDPSLGYRVFTQAALDGAAVDSAALGEAPTAATAAATTAHEAADPPAASAKRPAKPAAK